MHLIDTAGAVAVIPTPAVAGTAGYFSPGDPGHGVVPTILDADFMNALMMEIINVVTYAGLTPSKTDHAQLLAALNALYVRTGNSTGFSTYNGNPNTHVAGTAAGPSVFPGIVWDYANNVWYVCTTTGNAAAAIWTPINSDVLFYGPDTGGVNTLVVNRFQPLRALVDGAMVRVKIANTNNGNTTLAVSGLAAKPVKLTDGSILNGGELPAGGIVMFQYTTASGGAWLTTPVGRSGRLLNVRTLTGAGTYTATAGTNAVDLIITGDGGGGSGCASTSGGNPSAGVGGGSGATTLAYLTTGFAGVSYSVGAGGAGGVAGNNVGSAGAGTTFGAISVPGGPGGPLGSTGGSTLSFINSADPVAAGSGGYLNLPGNGAPSGHVLPDGAPSYWGGPGKVASPPMTTSGPGGAGSAPGAGGAGGHSFDNSARPGGAGAGGVIVIREYA